MRGLVALLLTTGVGAQIDPGPWREDLVALAKFVRSRHKAPFHTVGEGEFGARVAALDRRLEELERHEVIVEFARLVAGIDDGHSAIWPLGDPASRFRRWPIEFGAFAEGVFVTGAAVGKADLIGARLLKVDGKPASEVLRLLGPVVSADNEHGRRRAAARAIACPELVHAVGLTRDLNAVEFEFARGDARWRWKVSAVDAQSQLLRTPGSRRRPQRLSSTWSPENARLTLYVDAIADTAAVSFEEFFARQIEFAVKNEVRKFAIDLRRNGGGRGGLIRRVIPRLIRATSVDTYGRLFVLIGPRTFSAAQNFVNELEKYTNAIFVGEPTGARPNHFGDATRIRLPNSGLLVAVSTLWHQDVHPRDSRRATMPEFRVPSRAADFFAERDAALHAVDQYQRSHDIGWLAASALERGGPEAAAAAIGTYRAAHPEGTVLPRLHAYGVRELRRLDLGRAAGVLRVATEAFPDASSTWRTLAFIHRVRGENGLAAKCEVEAKRSAAGSARVKR